jgi:glutamate formiminotransferase / 5-formyltetrahydrofolate cyclo-ligase
VPNFSAGRDADAVAAVREGLAAKATVLDVHTDPVHDRSVYTLAAEPDPLVSAIAAGARAAVEAIDMDLYAGAHPAIGSLDVAPFVWLRADERDPARQAALGAARELAELGIPVFLYGDLASGEERRERAFFRRGGLEGLRGRMANGELKPDLGPASPHTSAGAALVTARPPLAAFNVVLSGAGVADAAAIAARLRESGGGLAGVRALAIDLGQRGMQISTNVHDPIAVPLGAVVERVRELGGSVSSAEIVGLVPAAALEGFPGDVPIEGFDAEHHTIEARLPSG